MNEYEKVMQILRANAQKSFVKRILDRDKYPVIKEKGGQVATHKMAWSEMNGKFIVYPTVLWDGKKLKDWGDDAFDQVLKTGNYIEFPSADDADWFSRRYKAAWGE